MMAGYPCMPQARLRASTERGRDPVNEGERVGDGPQKLILWGKV